MKIDHWKKDRMLSVKQKMHENWRLETWQLFLSIEVRFIQDKWISAHSQSIHPPTENKIMWHIWLYLRVDSWCGIHDLAIFLILALLFWPLGKLVLEADRLFRRGRLGPDSWCPAGRRGILAMMDPSETGLTASFLIFFVPPWLYSRVVGSRGRPVISSRSARSWQLVSRREAGHPGDDGPLRDRLDCLFFFASLVVFSGSWFSRPTGYFVEVG